MRLGSATVLLWVLLASPPAVRYLEADLVGHMVVQLPALAGLGALLGLACRAGTERWLRPWNGGGIPGLLLAGAAILFWMLPRSLDLALDNAWVDGVKFITVPGLIGLPLALSWPRLHPLIKGVVKTKLLAMLAVLAWLYHAAPLRICNNYLASDQERLAQTLLWIAAGLGVLWALRWFLGPSIESDHRGADPQPQGSISA